jgi:hypothetical protein
VPDLFIPRSLDFACGQDWGINAPMVIVWAALIGPSRIHIVHEWKQTGLSDEEIADGYHEHTKRLRVQVRYVAGDPTMFFRDGRNRARGQSRGESLVRAGMPLRPAVNDHEAGWARFHSWLRTGLDGEPCLTFDESCRYLRRTIPAARSDKVNADDMDRAGDIHGLDAVRYLLMSRPTPAIRHVDQPGPPPGSVGALVADLRARVGRHLLGAENVR